MPDSLQVGSTFIKSNEKADNSRGQGGDKTPSSVYAPVAPIANVSPPTVTIPEDWQRRTVDATPIAPVHGQVYSRNKKLTRGRDA